MGVPGVRVVPLGGTGEATLGAVSLMGGAAGGGIENGVGVRGVEEAALGGAAGGGGCKKAGERSVVAEGGGVKTGAEGGAAGVAENAGGGDTTGATGSAGAEGATGAEGAEGAEGPTTGCFAALVMEKPRVGKGANRGIFNRLHTLSSSAWLSKGLAR